MSKICYLDQKLNFASMEVVTRANQIMEEYAAQGYELTLRQLYYQFVSRAWIANNVKEYKRLGDIVGKARLAGLIDWEHLVDRTRGMEQNSHWSDPESVIDAAAEGYAIDKWEGQTYRPEVWVEKEALAGIVERACRDLDIPWFCCRGYTSLSEMWVGAMRLKRYRRAQQIPVVIHLGDHDPSGIDMSRDIEERLKLFVGVKVQVERIALNFDQIQVYNPPPNPAKTTDSRYRDYMDRFGEESWELDALEPGVMVGLIRDAVLRLRVNKDKWNELESQEREDRRLLVSCARRWRDVTEFLEQGEQEDGDQGGEAE